MAFRLPDDTQHLTIIGQNGSGKTQAALWHLSKRSFNEKPWIIIDFKRDDHIEKIPYLEEIETGVIPDRPGIFVVRPNISNPAPVADTLLAAYDHKNVGIWIDEGFLMGKNKVVEGAFEDILTQGRSKKIPLIILVQRPVWVSRFVFSESKFFQTFDVQDARDVDTATSVIPESAFIRLPAYHSSYYDTALRKLDFLAPVPGEAEILAEIGRRQKLIRKENGPRFI